MLIRLTYVSTANSELDTDGFKQILLQAQQHNVGADLTGMLVFNSNIFLQSIEGDRSSVNTLYGRIIADPRHHSVMLIACEEIKTRRWANWSMGFASANADNKALFLKHSTKSTFSPYDMCSESIFNLMVDLTSSVK